MYIQGKLLFANFIFNGYSTSAKDLRKQIVKTRHDYHMGYFLPSDFRIRYSNYTHPTSFHTYKVSGKGQVSKAAFMGIYSSHHIFSGKRWLIYLKVEFKEGHFLFNQHLVYRAILGFPGMFPRV
jgi:hypothetical protein